MAKAARDLPTLGLGIYLVEQDLTSTKPISDLFDVVEALTECVVVAETAEAAIKAATSLKSDTFGFGLSVDRKRLTATEISFMVTNLPRSKVRHFHRKSYVLSVGTRRVSGD